MKTLSEFEKDLRADGEGLSGDAFLVNRANCDLLQAWLREADAWVEGEGCRAGFGWLAQKIIHRDLLGTTQKPKQEGEK